MRTTWVRTVAGVASVAVAVALIGLVLPAIVGVGWGDIGAELGALSAATLVGLGVLWFAGLWTYTFVLTGSLPGLRHTQALVLNCAGSAISNVLPFGGAAGAALTFAMAGSWGHPRRAVAVSTVVSGMWNVLSRLALPGLGLIALVASGHLPGWQLTTAASVATVLLTCVLALAVATLTFDGPNQRFVRMADRIALALPTRAAALRTAGTAVSQLLRTTAEVIRRGWVQLTLGMTGYLGLQFLLFWACLAATSARVSTGAIVASFALSRLLAVSSITPGGIGVTESGTAALLVALGAPPAPTAAALIVFGFFTHAIEIPVGGLAWLTWAGAKRWRIGRNDDSSGSDSRPPSTLPGRADVGKGQSSP